MKRGFALLWVVHRLQMLFLRAASSQTTTISKSGSKTLSQHGRVFRKHAEGQLSEKGNFLADLRLFWSYEDDVGQQLIGEGPVEVANDGTTLDDDDRGMHVLNEGDAMMENGLEGGDDLADAGTDTPDHADAFTESNMGGDEVVRASMETPVEGHVVNERIGSRVVPQPMAARWAVLLR